MISYVNALNILQETALQIPPRETELPLQSAVDSILSRSIIGTEDVPHFDNSAMDGFALRSSSTLNASVESPKRLYVSALIAAGDDSGLSVGSEKMEAIEIMTGAPLPKGQFDSVVRVEDTEILPAADGMGKEILIRKPVRPQENVRARGSDFRGGTTIATAGIVVDPEYLMAFASLGIANVWVRKRLKVGVLSTGKELVRVGSERIHGAQIWNSSGPFLLAALNKLGCDAVDLGTIDDDPEAFSQVVRRGLGDGVDVFLGTGAVSMGKHDFVVEALRDLGARIRFHKVAIRPGKPICFAEFVEERVAFFGLPGNPISTAVGMRFFVLPFLRARLGLMPEKGMSASLRNEVKKPEGLRCFYKGRAGAGPDGLQVEVLQGQASYIVKSLLEANCWVVLEESGSQLPVGSRVEILPLRQSFGKEITS